MDWSEGTDMLFAVNDGARTELQVYPLLTYTASELHSEVQL